MTYVSNRQMAADHERASRRYYRRARAHARRAAECYDTAAGYRRHAAWLTRTGMAGELTSPAETEATARTWDRIGDTFLGMSFHDTDQARLDAGFARRYAALAA